MFNVGFSFWQVPRPTSGSSCCSSYRTGRPAPGTSNGPIGRRESSNWLIPKPSPNCGVYTKISLIWTTKQWGELWGNLDPQLKCSWDLSLTLYLPVHLPNTDLQYSLDLIVPSYIEQWLNFTVIVKMNKRRVLWNKQGGCMHSKNRKIIWVVNVSCIYYSIFHTVLGINLFWYRNILFINKTKLTNHSC